MSEIGKRFEELEREVHDLKMETRVLRSALIEQHIVFEDWFSWAKVYEALKDIDATL